MPIVETIPELTEYELERNKPMPSLNHAYVQSNLIFELKSRFKNKYTFLSELAIEMPEKPDAVPDISVYDIISVDFLHDTTIMIKMPLSIIEIISTSQSNDDILSKFERYFEAGVKSCWLVMPSLKAIAVYSNMDSYQFFTDEMILSDQITNINLPLNQIFV